MLVLQYDKIIMTVATTILNLPSELFHNGIFPYIDYLDVYNLGLAGSQKLKEISEAYVQLGKY